MESVLGPHLQTKLGLIPASDLQAVDFVLLYFSAHWCGPCRNFTPRLVEFYKEVNAGQVRMEVVFVSSDRDEAGFSGYFEEMPWVAVPYNSAQLRTQIGAGYGVQGIPKLLLVKKDGSVASEGCRSDVERLGPQSLERWRSLL